MKIEKALTAAMNATVVGSGDKTMILAHGYGGDQSLWGSILPGLAQHFRVLLFDWNFSGAVKDVDLFDPAKHTSYDAFADLLIQLVDDIGFCQSVFVGHSLSGMVGCIASIKRPDLFSRLVLLAASPRYLNADGYEGGFDASAVEDILSSIKSDFPKFASAFAPVAVDPNHPLCVSKFEKSFQRMRPETALSMAKTVFYSDHRDILPNVSVPCTIVQTADDAVVPMPAVHYMQQQIKGKSTIEMVDAQGHYPQLTAPDRLLALLASVLGF